ncbi:hypothetical protein [Streptomyces sp. NPDC014685]|uniref:hypothetical protein n=1 Tax=Streptomyces sp. NPDC014685 TaxID=3364881 RepID=UPI0036F67B00
MNNRPSNPLEQFLAQMGTVNDLVYQLTPDSPPAALAELRDALTVVTSTVNAMLGMPHSTTGCRFHPQGPVDPVAPPGWSTCLLCNTHRRRDSGTRRPDLPNPSTSR